MPPTKPPQPIKVKTEFPNHSHTGANPNEGHIVEQILIDLSSDDSEGEATPSILRCPYCIQTFLQKSSLNKHFKWHATAKNYGCPNCNKGLGSLTSWQKHIRTQHNNVVNEPIPKVEASRGFHCSYCDKKFAKKTTLKMHISNIHITEFMCDQCGSKYQTQEALEIHLETHKAITYRCEKCKDSFPRETDLMAHLKWHDHICGTCGRQFESEDALEKHVVKYVNAEVHICSICVTGFDDFLDFSAHILEHRGAKTFVCTSCDTYFVTEPMLEQHLQGEHGVVFT